MNTTHTKKRHGLQGQMKATKSAPRRGDEHEIQKACVLWFGMQPKYKHLYNVFFAVPNGGQRSKVTAGKMKAEGVKRGVADLLLLLPSGQHHYLCVEIKTATGRQSDSQKEFAKTVEAVGGKYVVCRTLEDFVTVISAYIDGGSK